MNHLLPETGDRNGERRLGQTRRRFFGSVARGAAAITLGGAALGVNQPASAAYPRVTLPVPWLTQYLWQPDLVTHCCGPTCAVMIDGYYRGFTPTSNDLVIALDNLAFWYGDKGYLPPYSENTDLGSGRNEIGTLLLNYGMSCVVQHGTSAASINNILSYLTAGIPCIFGCWISGGQLVNWRAPNGGHFSVAVGCDGTNMIVHNPGTHYPSAGAFARVSMSLFDQTWALNNRIYAPVFRR